MHPKVAIAYIVDIRGLSKPEFPFFCANWPSIAYFVYRKNVVFNTPIICLHTAKQTSSSSNMRTLHSSAFASSFNRFLNSNLVWQYMRSCNSQSFNLINGCTQFCLQQTWLTRRFMESCDKRTTTFQDSCGVGICITTLDDLHFLRPDWWSWTFLDS